MSWKEDTELPPGHQLTFQDALRTTLQDLFLKVVIPRWAMGLTKRFRRATLAFDELQVCKLGWTLHVLTTLFVAIPHGDDSRT